MKILPSAFLIFCLVLVSCQSAPRHEQAALVQNTSSPFEKEYGIQLSVHQKRLSNGLKIVFVENPRSPAMSYQTWVKAGSADEATGLTGLAHLFEHLMFKGTETYGPHAFFEELEMKGAEVNAFTTRDYTVFYQNFLPSLLPKVVALESQRLRGLKITAEGLEKERMVVLEERRMRLENTPDGKMEEAVWGLSYQIHPYRWPVIGTVEDLMSLKVEDVRAFYDRFYQPNNVTVVVVGSLKPDEVFSQIEKAYGKIPGGPSATELRRPLPSEPEQNGERRLDIAADVETPRLVWAYHAPSAYDPDLYALDVLTEILFNGETSRAHSRLVEQKEMLAGISASSLTPRFPGLMMVSAILRKGVKIENVEDDLNHLVGQTDFTDKEVEAAKRRLTLDFIQGLRTPFGMGQFLGTMDFFFGDPMRFRGEMANYLRVSKQDVLKAATRYLDPNHRTVVILQRKSK